MGDGPVCGDCMFPVDETGCGCTDRQGDEITGRLTPIPGMDHRFRIGHEAGDIFEEDDDFDGFTLTVEVDSLEQGEAFLRWLQHGLEIEREVGAWMSRAGSRRQQENGDPDT